MKDAHQFKLVELREKLQSMSLPAAGNKSELIARLYRADPAGRWTEEMDLGTTEEAEDMSEGRLNVEESSVIAGEPGISEEQICSHQRHNRSDRELEFTKRENELMRRELELIRRENEMLRRTQHTSSVAMATIPAERGIPKIGYANLKDMLPEFDGAKGCYRRWKEQLTLLQQMYQLDDNSTKLLIGAILTGNALGWFHSVPEHLSLLVDQLLSRMQMMLRSTRKKTDVQKRI